jgi:hypothetical protein
MTPLAISGEGHGPAGTPPAIVPGQRWRHRRERWRVVTVLAIEDVVVIKVARNTQRRSAPLHEDTLRTLYELEEPGS